MNCKNQIRKLKSLIIRSQNQNKYEIHKIPRQNQEKNENINISKHNHENHEIHRIPLQIQKQL